MTANNPNLAPKPKRVPATQFAPLTPVATIAAPLYCPELAKAIHHYVSRACPGTPVRVEIDFGANAESAQILCKIVPVIGLFPPGGLPYGEPTLIALTPANAKMEHEADTYLPGRDTIFYPYDPSN